MKNLWKTVVFYLWRRWRQKKYVSVAASNVAKLPLKVTVGGITVRPSSTLLWEEFQAKKRRLRGLNIERQVQGHLKCVKEGPSKVNVMVDNRIYATITAGENFGTIECPENHVRIIGRPIVKRKAE